MIRSFASIKSISIAPDQESFWEIVFEYAPRGDLERYSYMAQCTRSQPTALLVVAGCKAYPQLVEAYPLATLAEQRAFMQELTQITNYAQQKYRMEFKSLSNSRSGVPSHYMIVGGIEENAITPQSFARLVEIVYNDDLALRLCYQKHLGPVVERLANTRSPSRLQ